MTYRIYGGNPSPYSRKLRAILRYRRLPHVWKAGTPETLPEIAQVKPKLIPVLQLPESGELRVDSTPLAYLLEQRHAERSIIPPGAAEAFLCHLLEDFADEWLTKLMFHYRWHEDATALWASHWIVSDAIPSATGKVHDQMAKMFHDRQRGRMGMVGCTPENAPVIEASYARLLDILGPYVGGQHYLFGSRPSLADFGIYGQLSQLVIDPWPQRLCRERAPAVEAWVITLDDASGVDGEWKPERGAAVREALLEMVGAEYLPFLLANAQAMEKGEKEFSVRIRGRGYAQQPFAYQAKCFADIRRRWAELPAEARAGLEGVMEKTGCLGYLQ
ncbi:glutathione S-transferase [Solimonas sp. K1W22B-7]|uniref:glutathione S-transferase family protein n=1 Tax=Solimonas sp. K1W22B-7 TaxID=2303331 RepID=UPI000E330204|nr:glutathione S-transferase N-terminal domain-containing protein [Solimonas sp. K1W22B-7]AXQ27796.1 glutathione S-transferase [Solimonas sp. K1W22B-7]